MLNISRNNLDAFYKAIADKMPLYLPLVKGGEVNFGYYTDGAKVDIDTLKTVKSPKDVFFPQSETMMKFRTEGKTITIDDVRAELKPYVVFGVRACDYKAFTVLDNVFLQDPVDTFYKLRRDSGVIFTLACGKPESSCFCTVFGIDASEPTGDVTCWLDDNALYLRANTDKGQEVLKRGRAGIVDKFTLRPTDNATNRAVFEQLLRPSYQCFFKFGHYYSPLTRRSLRRLFSPSAVTCATKSFITWENFAPSAAETHSTRVRSLSIPR